MKMTFLMMLGAVLLVSLHAGAETLAEIGARLGAETNAAYEQCPYIVLARDYFSRYNRDPEAQPAGDETGITGEWTIAVDANAPELVHLMGSYLAGFLQGRMGVHVPVSEDAAPQGGVIRLIDSGGGEPGVPESFTIHVTADSCTVAGSDAAGVRAGVVKLVDRMGFREAPFLKQGEEQWTPPLTVRLGTIPKFGSYRELVFMGYNAVFVSGGDLYAMSRSDALPELADRRRPGALEAVANSAQSARKHGLKTYCFLNTRQKFAEDHPVFKAHPEVRGARTWKADGEFVLCTEHPLVKQWLRESVAGLFEADPALDGVVLIIGGEGFYHCYMRPYGVEKGHTNCPRCDALGAPAVVANLCKLLASAAREHNPDAEVIAWPYSAVHVWSADAAQSAFIRELGPGCGIFTEIEKDEFVEKPHGVRKHIWDYSIDLIGPGDRARQQIALCRENGLPIYLKSEPELGFEAPRLPHIPCMDRWVDRAEALAGCGANGAWVFPAFRPNYGTSASEINKLAWMNPRVSKDKLLAAFAARIAGDEAGPHVRAAWRHVSEAIEQSPELPPYYTGPYYLGPCHPMCADPEAEVPEVFYGRYLFHAEIADAEGLKLEPTFMTSPRGNVPVFRDYYRRMEQLLAQAVAEMDAAAPSVPERCRLMFDAEDSPVRWFYHTARTHANFYDSCMLRDALLAFAGKKEATDEEVRRHQALYDRWREVLQDERENTQAALPVMEGDVRLDMYYGGDHTFSHGADMIRAKLGLLDRELGVFLPGLAKRCGLDPR